MRIGVLTTVHRVDDVRIFHKEAKSLADAGHEVTIVAPIDEAGDPVDEVRAAGIAVRSLGPRPRGRLGRLHLWRRLAAVTRDGDFDAWHFHDPELLLVALAMQRRQRGVRLVYDAHEDLPKDIAHKHWVPKRLRGAVSVAADRVERWAMARCDLVVGATAPIADRAPFGTARALVRNYPVGAGHREFVEGAERSADPRCGVVYAGLMSEPRGLYELMKVAELLIDAPVRFTLVGSFDPPALEAWTREHAPANVAILGRRSFEETQVIIAQHHVGLCALHPVPNHLQGLPIKLFEYFQAGLAVIVSDFPTWRDIVDGAGAGVLVDPFDVHAIAAAIGKMTADPSWRDKLGRAGQEAATIDYTWEHEAAVLLAAYESLSNASEGGFRCAV